MHTFIGIGDIHGATAALEHIPGIGQAEAVIISGDMTNHGGPQDVAAVLAEVTRHNPRVLAQIGNMDKPEVDPWLSGQGLNLHRRAVELTPGLWAMGCGFSTPTPFGTPSEVADAVLGQWLDETHAQVPAGVALLLVCHTPPANTAADRIASGAHVGSKVVRAFIERVQPAVCLTGHIHESRAVDTLGSTVVVNPGALAGGGYARITFADGRLTAELLRAGEGA